MKHMNKLERVLEMRSAGKTVPEIADAMGIGKSTVYRWIANSGTTQNGKATSSNEGTAKVSTERDESGNRCEVTVKSLDVRTEDDALRVANIDTSIWYVDRCVVNSWEVTLGDTATGGMGPQTFTNWQVKLHLERKAPKAIQDGIAELLTRLPVAKPQRKKVDASGHLMSEISIYDPHFGKLSWGEEVGEDYNLSIAARRMTDAFSDLLYRSGNEVSEILIPVGGDYLHINDRTNSTPRSGNRLDVDSRLPKIFRAGASALINCIGMARKPGVMVRVKILPGNHDPDTVFYIGEVLSAYYRNCEDVEIDNSPKARKYYQWGVGMIGFSHGCDEKPTDLPLLMAGEAPEMWAATKHREFHVGHLHKKKTMHHVAGDSVGPVYVRVLPSICGPDYWHYAKGYTMSRKAAEAFVWHDRHGCMDQLTSFVEEA